MWHSSVYLVCYFLFFYFFYLLGSKTTKENKTKQDKTVLNNSQCKEDRTCGLTRRKILFSEPNVQPLKMAEKLKGAKKERRENTKGKDK